MDGLYEARMLEFGNAYEDLEGTDIQSLLEATGDWLEILLMDSVAVDAAMRLLCEKVYGLTDPREAPWRELLKTGDSLEPMSAQFMVSLNAFAFFGLPPKAEWYGLTAEDACVTSVIEAHIGFARKLHDSIPRGWSNIHDLTITVLAAEARYRIDTERDVTIEQLAALAKISPKSVRNMLTPKAGGSTLTTTAAGEIPYGEALRWLLTRDSFKTSIWKDEIPTPRIAQEIDINDLGEVVFVPVAKDGSWFNPAACRTKRGYTIGPKGAEELVEDYRIALERLARMPTPYWRRPNPIGNWGLVAGVNWQRRAVSDLRFQDREEA